MSIFNFKVKKSDDTVTSETVKHETVSSQTQHATEATSNEQGISPVTGEKTIHNLIILDESGSMISIYKAALNGVNETLQTIRQAQVENPGQKHLVTLVTFDTGHYNKIYDDTPAAYAPDLNEKQYQPNGGTPLFDAMGKSLNGLRPDVKDEDLVLVTIITDGEENSSREYNGKAIKALVDSLKAQGWIFTYIGANQDVEEIAESMGINNRMAFDADMDGTREMFAKELKARKKFYCSINPFTRRNDLADTSYFED